MPSLLTQPPPALIASVRCPSLSLSHSHSHTRFRPSLPWISSDGEPTLRFSGATLLSLLWRITCTRTRTRPVCLPASPPGFLPGPRKKPNAIAHLASCATYPLRSLPSGLIPNPHHPQSTPSSHRINAPGVPECAPSPRSSSATLPASTSSLPSPNLHHAFSPIRPRLFQRKPFFLRLLHPPRYKVYPALLVLDHLRSVNPPSPPFCLSSPFSTDLPSLLKQPAHQYSPFSLLPSPRARSKSKTTTRPSTLGRKSRPTVWCTSRSSAQSSGHAYLGQCTRRAQD